MPITLVTGFLEGGKTTAIRSILERGLGDYTGRTLLIDTEEDGIEIYPPELLRARNVTFFDLDGAFSLTEETLRQMESKVRPSQVLIEYGGMFSVSYFDGLKLPERWEIARQMSVFDGSVLLKYMDHLRGNIEDMVRDSDVILLNRCEEVRGKGCADDREYFREYFARVAPQAKIVFEDLNGNII